MTKILIPFTDPDSGERAVWQLVGEAAGAAIEVELLAVVEPVECHQSRVTMSRERAEQAARAVATCWLARIGPVLDRAGIAHSSRVVIGHPATEIEAALHRADVDRVMLPASAPRWPAVERPVTLVA